MKNWTLYRILLHLLPAGGLISSSTFPADETWQLQRILHRHRCLGASLCAFDPGGVTASLTFGQACAGVPVTESTVFRAASISKFITGLGILRLRETGRIPSLDEDVNGFLPFPLRHPGAPKTPLTLRLLMTHTAGIHDGNTYNSGIADGLPLSAILAGDSFTSHLPGTLWEYSNLGAGIAGSVLEGMTGRDFETLMQETVFAPLGVTATFYPQKLPPDRVLADARRILPPHRGPNFDAGRRRSRPLPSPGPDPLRHYNLAHGNLCVSAPDLARLGIAAMAPGFLSADSLADMRREAVPFGERARNLSQGLFTFILREPKISSRPLYGHQGMAYGAVHGLFFDPVSQRGMAVLTTGASEARRGVLADLNSDLLSLLLGE